MKKCYLLLVIIACCYQSKAQIYYPMLDSVSNTWYFVSNVIPLKPSTTPAINCFYGQFLWADAYLYSTQGDTMINGFNYKILQEQDYWGMSPDCNYGYLREDTATKKIYFVDNIFSPEEVLYDFSMQVGDSLNINFYQSGGYFASGYYTLDSISTVTIPAGVRNLFYLNNHSQPFSLTLQWIEGVGHPGHIVYTRSCNFGGGFFSFFCLDKIDRSFCQMLTCFEHANYKVYFDSCSHQFALNNFCVQYIDSCNYWNICSSVEEVNFISSFDISPNPASEQINISLQSSKASMADFILRDVTGKEILISANHKIIPGKQTIPIRLPQFDDGIYIMECRMKEGTVFRKMVISQN